MAVKECERGHLYNTDIYDSCPYCSGNSTEIDFSQYGGKRQGVGAVGKTVAPSGYGKSLSEAKKQPGGNKTVGVFKKHEKYDPVVGWLVCIGGVNLGRDYRLFDRQNKIGRETGDVIIQNDPTISRENHARIAYDRRHNSFMLIPGESTNNIYLNDEPVYVPVGINEYDKIELGDSAFLFVPFCCSRFMWGDDDSSR
ncbi:MAG: FHA domain-containing protein [Lachnospiraceae bacterium]|nr:FHA domain-containing protein [Lachnospiraceae bacterium]